MFGMILLYNIYYLSTMLRNIISGKTHTDVCSQSTTTDLQNYLEFIYFNFNL